MRRIVALILIAGLIFASSPVHLAIAALPSSVLFLSHFDGNTKNERNGASGTASEVSYQSAKFGQGVYIDEGDILRYSSSGNFTYQKGTIEFWIKPSWSTGTGDLNYYNLLVANIEGGGEASDANSIQIFKKSDDKIHTFMVGDPGGLTEISAPITWVAGELHHVAVTWDMTSSPKFLRLYLDGNFSASSDPDISGGVPTQQMPFIFVGTYADLSDSVRATLDELIIFNYAKTTSGILADYNLGKAFFPPPSPPPSPPPPSPPSPPPAPSPTPEPPEVLLKNPTPNPTRSSKPKISGTATFEVEITKIEYSLDRGANWIPSRAQTRTVGNELKFSFKTKKLVDGNYQILVRVTDSFGNKSTSNSIVLVVDTLPPRLGGNAFFLGPQKLFPTENGFLSVSSGSEVSMVVSAVGGPTGVQVKTNGEVFSLQRILGTSLWQGQIAFEEEGSFNLKATSVDGAGNIVIQKLTPILVSGRGTVNSPSGEPLEEALVSLYVQVNGEWQLLGAEVFGQENPQETDKTGGFSYFLPSGTYQLRAAATGYREFISEAFTLERSQPVSPSITMESRPTFMAFGRRFTLPWFLDFWARRKEVQLDISVPEVEPPQLGIGKQAPDFNLPDQNGKMLKLSSLRGSKVLLTFWTTWDPLSSEQIAVLSSLSVTGDTVILPIAIQETRGRTKIYLARGNYQLRSLVDRNGDLGKSYTILSLPQHVLVGKDGKIADVKVGALSAEEVLELIELVAD